MQGQLARSLKPRDPLIQWHLKTLDPQQPQGAFDECVLVHGRESCAARYAELREALRSVIPCFVALISEAVRRRPALAHRISAQLLLAAGVLASWPHRPVL